MTRKPTNIAASVSQRLLQRSQSLGEDYQLTLQRYAIERLLFRLSQSPAHDRFVLKGAMLYLVWGGEIYRPTRDLDLLGYGADTAEAVNDCFRSLCSIEVKDDGLVFLPDTVRSEKIRDAAEYGGLRVRLEARLDKARIRVQVDIGFGDVVVPGPEEKTFPVLLEGPAPRIRAYSRESVVAEKLHAAAVLGDANSRLKDFYDLFALSTLFSFEGPTLTRAIAATFTRRRTPLPEALPLPEAFFADEVRAGRWRTYLAKNGLRNAPQDFAAAGEAIREFLARPYEALLEGGELPASWAPGGPWR
ncbi:MAG TPA: nucleotidyl transferase AbiEii/AbiGii toxin family protein [Thermoanaerobaculia bacterium]